MKKFEENLKIGCRHSLVPSVQEQKQKFGYGTIVDLTCFCFQQENF